MGTELKLFDNKQILVIDEIPEYNIEDYDLSNKKDFNSYVKDCERIIRNSFEYRKFIAYLRNYMDMNKCSFFQNVNNIETTKIKIHIHHCPFTLYDLVLIVYNKKVFYHENLEIENVAMEVMYIHYYLMVGLIPLAETVHELVHDQIVFIPLNKVMGNYEEILHIYEPFIPDDTLNRYYFMKQQTQIYNEALNLQVLQQTPLYIQIPHEDYIGSYNVPSMEKIIELMKQRIDQIKIENSKKVIDMKHDNNEPIELIKPIVYNKENELIKPITYAYRN